MTKTAYNEAKEQTKKLAEKREARKGLLLGSINIEDAIDMLIKHLKDDAVTEEVMDILEASTGAFIEVGGKHLLEGDPILNIYETNNYCGFFDGKLEK